MLIEIHVTQRHPPTQSFFYFKFALSDIYKIDKEIFLKRYKRSQILEKVIDSNTKFSAFTLSAIL